MSSEEDFSLVTVFQQTSGPTLEEIQASISKYKKKHEQLLQDQKDLLDMRDQSRNMAQQFRQRTENLIQNQKEEKRLQKEKVKTEKDKVKVLQQQQDQLMQELLEVEAALKEEEGQNKHLKEQSEVFTAVPERVVYFNGLTATPTGMPAFDVEPRIVYPMEEGTMLITFEEEVVASKILNLKKHQVDLEGECSITVEARPVQLMVPRLVEIDTEVCPRRILISKLPKMDAENLLNKLEIHFSKRKHGGGEVEHCELMADSWTVVLTFVEKDVAKGLTDKEDHEVNLKNKKYRVKVTPFLKGNITDLKTEMAACPLTVLLSGIPDIMERETLQDLLEIHFQKSSNGGGEIQAVLYNPPGHNTTALFEGPSRKGDSQ